MKEAVLAVTDYAFDVVGMKEMILSNSELNLGSTRIKQLSGTVEIGREPRDYHTGPGVAVYYRLTADSWRANRHRMA